MVSFAIERVYRQSAALPKQRRTRWILEAIFERMSDSSAQRRDRAAYLETPMLFAWSFLSSNQSDVEIAISGVGKRGSRPSILLGCVDDCGQRTRSLRRFSGNGICNFGTCESAMVNVEITAWV